MAPAPAEAPKQRALLSLQPDDLPEWVKYALRLTAGLSIVVNIQLLSWVALLLRCFRALLCLPEPGKPRPAYFRLTSDESADEASADDAASDDSDASDCQSSDGSLRAANAAIYIDIVPSKDGLSKAAPPAPGAGPRLIEVMHVKVDAKSGADSEAWRLIGPYMRLYGEGALHSSTLWNPEFVHMFVPGIGSQAYITGSAYHRTIVVGINDPVAHPDHWAEMAATFSRAFPGATYTHIGPRFAQVLRETQGYTINDAGAETNIQVQKFAYSKRTRTIRNGARDARAAGVAVRELRQRDLTPDVCRQLMAVTGDWLELKTVKEDGMRVYIRSMDYENIQLAEGVRLFVAESELPITTQAAEGGVDADVTSEAEAGKRVGGGRGICGFVLLDPLFRDGGAYGYVTSINRMFRSSHPGVLKLLYDDIMAVMKKEGKEVLAFGFSPFFNIQKTPFCGPWWMELSMRFMFHFANNLYGFKNLAFSKARYGGGVVGDAYHNPAVTMTHVYGATWAKAVPDMALLDNYVLMMATGFTGTAGDAFRKLASWQSKPKGGSPGGSSDDDGGCGCFGRSSAAGGLSSFPSGALSSATSGTLSAMPSGALSTMTSAALSTMPSGALSAMPSGALSALCAMPSVTAVSAVLGAPDARAA